MANDQAGAAAQPVLTATGINKLIARLDADLQVVNASTAPTATAARKQVIQNRIGVIQTRLHAALINPDPSTLTGWVVDLAPRFLELSSLLKQAVPDQVGNTGACFYQGGCIVSTQAQCTVLGGDFHPGVDCQGNPLP
jgi:hypothetical protein